MVCYVARCNVQDNNNNNNTKKKTTRRVFQRPSSGGRQRGNVVGYVAGRGLGGEQDSDQLQPTARGTRRGQVGQGKSGQKQIGATAENTSRGRVGRTGRKAGASEWREGEWREGRDGKPTRSHQQILSDNLYVRRLCQVGGPPRPQPLLWHCTRTLPSVNGWRREWAQEEGGGRTGYSRRHPARPSPASQPNRQPASA